MSQALQCWSCGQGLEGLPMPLSRTATCPACEADLYVCRMCGFYAPNVAKSCRETIAEEVRDKERANFCDYFQAVPGTHGTSDAADTARQQLESLFGLESGKTAPGLRPDAEAMTEKKRRDSDDAQGELKRLFGLDEE